MSEEQIYRFMRTFFEDTDLTAQCLSDPTETINIYETDSESDQEITDCQSERETIRFSIIQILRTLFGSSMTSSC